MKRLLLCLVLSARCLLAAETPITVQFADSELNGTWSNEDFWWTSDRGPDFDAKIYTHVLRPDNSRSYSNTANRAYGGFSWSFYDAFNTSYTRGPLHYTTHVFFLFRYHYSGVDYTGALFQRPWEWPQAVAAANMWRAPLANEWWADFMSFADGEYWCVWVLHYNCYLKTMYAEKLDGGGPYSYPANVDAYTAQYGQW